MFDNKDMWVIIVLFILSILLITAYLLLRRAGGGKFPWIKFYLQGKESGFIFKEINLLRKIAVGNRMKDPTSLFWSIKQLDRCIKGIILKFRSNGQEEDVKSIMMISKLFNFRKRVEFNKPKYTLGLKSSREISPRQRIRISLHNIGPFSSIVVDSLRKYMAISYPHGPKLPFGFSWKGQTVSINFWREGDAGYYYQTKVLGDFTEKKYPILHIAHKDNIIRAQMRKSVRVETNVSALMFPLRTIEEANEIFEENNGLRCILVDVSEDGAAVLVGGRAKVGLPVKCQFMLANKNLVINGIVKGVNFDEKKKRSILHIQARVPSISIKNNIQSYIYNIFGEQEEKYLRSSAS